MNLRIIKLIPNVFKLREFGLTLLLALISGILFNHLYLSHAANIFTYGENVWFQGDISRVYESMTSRFSYGHYRAKVHPLFSILTTPIAFALNKVFNLNWYQTIQIIVVAIACIWALAMYTLLRLIGCLKTEALLFSIFGLSSAAALFWLSVPESYGLGSISIITALSLAAIASQKSVPAWLQVLISSFSLSITVTNWMTGILSSFTTNSYRRAAKITISALIFVAIIWVIQKQIFPTAVFFIGDTEESKYVYFPTTERIINVLKSFFLNTIFAPNLLVSGYNIHNWPMLSFQTSEINISNFFSALSILLWTMLLTLGLWAIFTLKKLTAFRITLGLTIIGQLLLHLIYGEETFLYSLHFLPILIALSALALLTHLRKVATSIVIALIPLCAFNNWQTFQKARDIAIPPRQEVIKQIALRPMDFWSKFDSHAIVAIPGSLENDKAYIEPGGSFSPKVGSFGLSVWMMNNQQQIIHTSDTLKPSVSQQALFWPPNSVIPSIVTISPFYKSTVGLQANNRWSYDIKLTNSNSHTPLVVIRSVGPAGGPIYSLRWDHQRLLVNDKWHLTFDPMPKHTTLGEEGSHPWHASTSSAKAIQSQKGWAFANLAFDASQTIKVRIEELNSTSSYLFPTESIGSRASFNLPDQRFSDSLNAQIAHLMMSVVKDETRPGDPINYPINWQRDGAYILVALAKAGQLQKAETLSKVFAEQDFFGGFGAEADAPGLSLWALNQVASTLNDFTYDAYLWPHVRRKAALIEQMLTTKERIYQPFTGKVVPLYIAHHDNHLVAEPAKDGLIVGRMDHHRPLLSINAVSYLGLLEAADIAHRLGKNEEHTHWLNLAQQLKSAWEQAFTANNKNERTYISALWPTHIAQDSTELFRAKLTQRWEEQHDENNQFRTKPLWTYFNIAEAHQWLYLGQPNHVWSTLEWFWQHQSMPNLYTWWEGEGEENSFGIWQNIRGWVNPKNVNPHYWTAAEIALLQMDMLAYLDTSKDQSTLIIGAGIPSDWLSKPMDVRQLRVGPYLVDWHWKNNVMNVVVIGKQPLDVKLAAHFPASARLIVSNH